MDIHLIKSRFMKVIKSILLFLGIVFMPVATSAQDLLRDSSFVQLVKQGVDAAYNMDAATAERVATNIEQNYNNHPIAPLLRGVVQWWNILVDLDNRSSDDAFHRQMTEALRRAERMDKNSFDAALVIATVNGLKSRLSSNRSSWMGAFKYGRRAVDKLALVAKLDPQSNDYAIGWGLYDYFSVALAERYRAVNFLMRFFPDGSKERGIAELERTMQDGLLMQPEAAYWLFQIYYNYDADFAKASFYINWLRQRYPNNAFYLLLHARLLEQSGRNQEAQALFNTLKEKFEAGQPGYAKAGAEQAYYYIARQYYFDKDWEKSYEAFKKATAVGEQSRDKSKFLTLSYFFLGRVSDVLQKRTEALGYYRRSLQLEDVGNTHDRVKEHLNSPYQD